MSPGGDAAEAFGAIGGGRGHTPGTAGETVLARLPGTPAGEGDEGDEQIPRVAIMRGRYLLGLSNANRQAAGVVIGAEAEVKVEFDAEPLEQRPVPCRYPVDVGLHLWRHDGGHVPGLRFDPVSCSAVRTPQSRSAGAAALSAARPPSASGRWDPATRTSAAPGRPSAPPPHQHPARGTAKRREWHRCRRWPA